MTSKTPLSPSFLSKKQKILAQLAVPIAEYDDLSPKGSIDEGIRDLIDEINACEGFVTTSSCAGRISVFAEGDKNLRIDDDPEGKEGHDAPAIKPAGIGGKGGGGKWLFVSHDAINLTEYGPENLISFLGMEQETDTTLAFHGFSGESEKRLIHFKFEPMILHILTASPQHAQIVLIAALQAGFRESGALNLTSNNPEAATPMVAVRSMGLALESIIGQSGSPGRWECFAPGKYLQGLLEISNSRFAENTRRISRFRELLAAGLLASNGSRAKVKADGTEWEDALTRRERMRAEGLKKSQKLKEETVEDE